MELLPCPFCGEKHELRIEDCATNIHVVCLECGAVLRAGDRVDLIKKWNTRHPSPNTESEKCEHEWNEAGFCKKCAVAVLQTKPNTESKECPHLGSCGIYKTSIGEKANLETDI